METRYIPDEQFTSFIQERHQEERGFWGAVARFLFGDPRTEIAELRAIDGKFRWVVTDEYGEYILRPESARS